MRQHDGQELNAAQALLDELSVALDSPLRFDAAGQCALGFDGGVEILLSVDEEGSFLSISSALGVATNEATRQAALTMNYGRLPPSLSIALDPASEGLSLFCLLPAAGLAGEDFVKLLMEFVALCPMVRDRLTASVSKDLPPPISLGAVIRG